MDFRDEKNHFFNIKLAKLTGLYQISEPKTIKFRGRNIYHIVMACVLVYMCFISMILLLGSLYYWTVNIPISMDYFNKSVTSFYIIYKTVIIICHSNDVWNCLSITRVRFYVVLQPKQTHTGSLARSFGVIHDHLCDNIFDGDIQLLGHHLGIH